METTILYWEAALEPPQLDIRLVKYWNVFVFF